MYYMYGILYIDILSIRNEVEKSRNLYLSRIPLCCFQDVEPNKLVIVFEYHFPVRNHGQSDADNIFT